MISAHLTDRHVDTLLAGVWPLYWTCVAVTRLCWAHAAPGTVTHVTRLGRPFRPGRPAPDSVVSALCNCLSRRWVRALKRRGYGPCHGDEYPVAPGASQMARLTTSRADACTSVNHGPWPSSFPSGLHAVGSPGAGKPLLISLAGYKPPNHHIR